MKIVLQRVLSARVDIGGERHSEIGRGYLLLLGFEKGDDPTWTDKAAEKIAKLRVFADQNGKTNLSLKDVGGEILSVSQFTLAADLSGGNRPGFSNAMEPGKAKAEYLRFNGLLRGYGYEVKEGVFGADMEVGLVNDGPFTVLIDGKSL